MRLKKLLNKKYFGQDELYLKDKDMWEEIEEVMTVSPQGRKRSVFKWGQNEAVTL